MDRTSAIAVFMYDGSEKYSAMTISSVKSFLNTTKGVNVGLLVHPSLTQPNWANLVGEENKNRIDVRFYRDHFTQWNPTQYKLDIQQYSDTYDYVLWIDSDTLFFDDLNSLISDFAKSNCIAALVEDLVTSKPGFQTRWAKATQSTDLHPFVPQAALMAFKKPAFEKLFPVWENIWRKWIEPAPFANYGDPDPAFPGSAFCIEQYALGLALEQLEMLYDGSLFYIPRRQVLFKDARNDVNGIAGQVFRVPFSALVVGANDNHNAAAGSSFQQGSYALSSYNLTSGQLGSYQLGSSQLGSFQLGSYQLGSGQLGSYQLGSYQLGSGQLGSYQLGSGQLGSYQLGSYQLGSGQLGSYQLGSGQLGSYQLGSGQLGSYQLGSYQLGSSQLGSSGQQLGSYQLSGGSTVGSYSFDKASVDVNENQYASSGFVGVLPVNNGLSHDIVVDSFAGSVLHFYSFNYPTGINVYNQQPEQIQSNLQQLWK